MQINKTTIGSGLRWIYCGWLIFCKDARSWFGMAALYILLAVGLRAIPFLGVWVLILLTPIMWAGAVLSLHRHEAGSGSVDAPAVPAILEPQGYFRGLIARLFQSIAAERKTQAAVILAILTLGGSVAVTVAEQMLIGGSLVSVINTLDLQPVRTTTALALPVVAIFYLIAAAALLFTVPLIMLDHIDPITAVVKSLAAARRNILPLAVFFLVYSIPWIAIALTFRASPGLGYLLVFALGTTLLPLFVTGLYCGYRDLYGAATSSSQASD